MIRQLSFAFALLAAPALAAPPPAVSALAYHPNGKFLAAGLHGEVAIVDSIKGEVVARLGGQTGRVTAIAFSRDGMRLAVASGEPAKSGVVKLYAVSEAGPKFEAKGEIAGPKDVQYALDFAPDHKTLALAGYDRIIRIWDTEASKPINEFKDHSDTIYGVGFSPDGKLLASASADRTVKMWNAATGKRLYTLGEPTDWVYALAWHPDGKHLAAAGVDKSIRVWEVNAESGKLVQSVFGHTQPITKIAYSKDGQYLYSLGEGKNLKKWDAAKLVEKLVFPPQPETMLSLAVRPDGKQIAIGRYDGVLQLLDAESGKVSFSPLPASAVHSPLSPLRGRGAAGEGSSASGKTQNPSPQPPPRSGEGEKKVPTVGKLTPNFGVRGQTTKAMLEGQHFDGDLTVSANVAGVSVKVSGEGGKRELAIEVAKNVPPGFVALTVKSAAGSASPINFIVDRYPAPHPALPHKGGREREGEAGNDSARQGKPIALPATLVGTIARAGEADYFRFTAKTGQEIGAQILTAAIGSKLDPLIELTDADGRVLVESTNGLLGYTCPAAGTYAIGIHDKEYRGGADMFYRLHVGDIPIVTAVHPMGVERGKSAAVRLVGVNLRRAWAVIDIRADATIGSRVAIPFVERDGYVEKPLGDAGVIVGEFPEEEVLNGRAKIATPGTANGMMTRHFKTHAIRFAAKKGERLLTEVNARRAGSPLDSVIEVLDTKMKPVGRATLRSTARTYVVFRDHDSASPGIRIESWNDLAMDDYVVLGNEVLRIAELPLNPDADCNFYAVNGQRVGFFDTTPSHHPNGAPIYKVEMHPFGTTFPPNGLPVFNLTYRNDDGGPGYGKDSRLFFDPPADGEYVVRIGDARGEGGPNFGYRLTVRPPRPDFSVSFNPTAPSVWKGGAIPIGVTVNRIDGYDGPVQVALENLPPGLEAPKTFVEAGQQSTTFALYATPQAANPAVPLKLVARATIGGKEIVREAMGGVPKVIDPGDLVTIAGVDELTIRPGSEARMRVKIERRNGFKGRVPLDVKGLPHGVRVLDVGLNGILITERDTEREIAIYAEPWVKSMEHPFVVLSRREGKNTEHAAKSVLLRVEK
jgi:WD40 repeat protein